MISSYFIEIKVSYNIFIVDKSNNKNLTQSEIIFNFDRINGMEILHILIKYFAWDLLISPTL